MKFVIVVRIGSYLVEIETRDLKNNYRQGKFSFRVKIVMGLSLITRKPGNRKEVQKFPSLFYVTEYLDSWH